MTEPKLNDLQEEVFTGLKNFGRIFLMLILSVGFLGSGMLKLVKMPELVLEFTKWGFPLWFMYIVGVFELILAIFIFYQPTRGRAALITIIFMLSATAVHIYHGEFARLFAPSILILVSFILLYIERTTKQ